MKNFLTSFIFSASCFLVNAQQTRFIYLQTENRQPFFVKLDNKILNSYPLGYLIIPRLDDGLYSLVIGFPESSLEQEFNCPIKNKDVGFIIKNAGDKQWQLLNIQTLNIILPGDISNKQVVVYEKETDPFSTMLANAVQDSTILRRDVAKEIIAEKKDERIKNDSTNTAESSRDIWDIKKNNTLISDSGKNDIKIETVPEKNDKINQKDSATLAIKNDVSITKSDSSMASEPRKKDIAKEVIPEKINEPIQKDTSNTIVKNSDLISKKDSAEIVKTLPQQNIESNSGIKVSTNNDIKLLKSVIKRKLKKSSKEGIEMMYVDDDGAVKDTIRIFIPSDKKKQNDEEIKITDPVITTPITQPDKPVIQTDNKQNISDKPDYKISSPEKQVTKPIVKEPVFINSPMINSDCKNFATDEDFLKIRKKMVAENNEENMIKVAKKIFKTKCFTTEQIKNLSVLFLKDEGKYMFFDASYAFVSDSDQYYTLERQLTDNYYITRFRAMIHK